MPALPRALAATALLGLVAPLALASASPAAAAVAPVGPAQATTVPTAARALSAYTTTPDGVPRYRIGTTELPPPVAVGTAFLGELEWRVGTDLRRVRVYVPSTAGTRPPLVVSLHGLSNTVVQAERQQRWRHVGFSRGAVVAWAGGISSSWAAGGGCCGEASRRGIDDVAYLDRVRALVAALRPVSSKRVFLAGFSNGAMMAYRYACERPGVVAGVLSVAGTMTSPCRPRNAVAVLAVNGTADIGVPLAGTAHSAYVGVRLPPPRDAVRRFAAAGGGVRSVVLKDVAHVWPTLAKGGYDATGQGWRFLMAHPRP